ncbi:MAG TPA: TRAP transporter small permease [Rhizobiaceae bacterium]|nr:TRAP transporter small permease [Rhizobiaceae bacterium]
MRKLLEGLYGCAEVLAMAALVVIALMVGAQVLGRVADTVLVMLGQPPYGFLIPSLAEFAGFFLVAASFLALAGTLRGGVHIRVTVATSHLPPTLRRGAEILVLVIAAALMLFIFWYSARLALDSYSFNEVSYGIIAVPLWIPQAAMAAGAGIFAIALLDDLVCAVRGGTPSYVAEEALHGQEGQ